MNDLSQNISPRISRNKVAGFLLLGFLVVSGCASTAIDKARVQLGSALDVMYSAQGRYKTQELVYLLDSAKPPQTKQGALRLYEAYKLKRQPVEEEITRCQVIADEARDLLLLSDDVKGVPAAENAAKCASSMLDKVNKLFGGG